MKDGELNQFVNDMGVVMRREYDCWIEQCWCVRGVEAEQMVSGEETSDTG